MDDNTNNKPADSNGTMDDVKQPASVTPDPTSRPIIQNQDVQSDPMVNEAINAGVGGSSTDDQEPKTDESSPDSSPDPMSSPGSPEVSSIEDSSTPPTSTGEGPTPPPSIGDSQPSVTDATPSSDPGPTVSPTQSSPPSSSFTASSPDSVPTTPDPQMATQPPVGVSGAKKPPFKLILYILIALIVIVIAAVIIVHK